MENELTFVAPEGVYSVTEEHKPTPFNAHIVTPVLHPTRLSTVTVRYPLSKSAVAPGIAQLWGGGKDRDNKNKEKDREHGKEREDRQSLSSSEKPGTEEDGSPDLLLSPTLQPQSPSLESPKLFSPTMGMSKKKSASRPKHNIRTTTSTFVTRLQSVDNLNKILQSKQGDVTYLFYNAGKNFFWTELGKKMKVRFDGCCFASPSPTSVAGSARAHNVLCVPDMPRCEQGYPQVYMPGRRHWIQHRRPYLVRCVCSLINPPSSH